MPQALAKPADHEPAKPTGPLARKTASPANQAAHAAMYSGGAV